jgi:acylglycerol lipase
MHHTTGEFHGAGGLRLHEQSWLPDGDSIAAVVLHHGLWDYGDYYAPFAEELTRRGYSVFAYDMRGHGTSDGQRAFVQSFEHYVQDLEIFLQRVRQQIGDQPLFLFGHSLGGLIAATYGAERPDNGLRGFILSGAGLKPGKDVSPLLKAIVPVIGTLAPSLPSYKPDFAYASRDRTIGERKAQDPLIDHKGLPARSGAEGLRAMANLQGRMEQFVSPVLVMHGTADRWTNSEGSQEFAQRAGSQDKTLKLYEGFYHELLSDTDRQQVWNDVIGWMEARR